MPLTEQADSLLARARRAHLRRRLSLLAAEVQAIANVRGRLSDSELRHQSQSFADLFSRRRRQNEMHVTRGERIAALGTASAALSHTLGFIPNELQIVGALLLNEGKVVELATGEGKTVMAMLASYWGALQGDHVDIATTNDYLATRDRDEMGRVFNILGISVGLITSTTDRKDRKAEYQRQITYAANQELGFDYLRDNQVFDLKDEVCGAHDFVIIDEVDSILIDEARTELIIGAPSPEGERQYSVELMKKLTAIGDALVPGRDYAVDYRNRATHLTEEGTKAFIAAFGRDPFAEKDTGIMRAFWCVLYAKAFLKQDKDFIIQNGKAILVDEFTGHALPDRVLFEGLQEAVEVRAGLEPARDFGISAAITYRNLFKLYHRIAGMTGTAFDARGEFLDLYNLDVDTLGTFLPTKRRDEPTRMFRVADEKYAAIITAIAAAAKKELPVLAVGRSIESVRHVSKLLAEKGITHEVLTADVGARESEIIKKAGAPGSITIATNMAGRGADIILDNSFRYEQGLLVIGIEHNLSHRIDRQMRGRSGRHGESGTSIIYASLEDELLQVYADDDFWDYAESIEWPTTGVVDGALADGVRRAQDTARDGEAQSRVSLARFDTLIDHHRSETYRTRRTILADEKNILELRAIIQKILLDEPVSRMDTADLKRVIGWEAASAETKMRLDRFLIEGEAVPIYDWLTDEAITVGNLRKIQKEALALLDQEWERYLDSVGWLEGWVGLSAIGANDPYTVFAEDASQMFHDMRRTFAAKAVIILFKYM